MEPRIVSRPAFSVVGMMYRGKNANNEIPQLGSQFAPRMDAIKHVTNPHVAYGVCGNCDESSHDFDYAAAMEVDTVAEIPEGMVSWDVPNQEYAVFTCTLPTLREVYQYADRTWLPQSGHRRAAGPDLEIYDERFDPEDPTSEMEIFIPIV